MSKVNNHMIKISEIKFHEDKFTFLLMINKFPLEDNILKYGIKRNLLEKNEFHFTIMGSRTGKKILEIVSDKNKVVTQIIDLINSINWSITLKNEFYYIEKYYNEPSLENPEINISEERSSIIQIANIEGLSYFYQELEKIIDYKFELPLPHLTLFTNSTREDKKQRGIGIYSESEFIEMNPKKI